ncbi:MAG: ATP-binding protein [Cyanobacteriota bacterium]|nr:ATP-binding protein [Cyanobacteriota bacterium]
MLIEFSVKNYRSFQECVTFSLVTAKIPLLNKKLRNNRVKIDEKLSLLKTTVIYGANGSGKSNLIKAFQVMQDRVLASVENRSSFSSVQPFRYNSETINQPSRFEIVVLIDKIIYRYGFEIISESIHHEWLYFVPEHQEIKLFERNLNQFEFFPSFSNSPELVSLIQSQDLLLSVADKFNLDLIQPLLYWFKQNLKIIPNIYPNFIDTELIASLKNPQIQQQVLDFLKPFNLGIDRVTIQPTPDSSRNQPIIKIIRSNDQSPNQQFDFYENESLGTQKLLQLAIILVDALNSGQVVWIDSLDLNLHPLFTKTIIELFHQRETNPQNAQLIFTAYQTSLLNPQLLRRDQIWFTNKDKMGKTDLYSLAEFKIKNDTLYDQDYLLGKYGGIPLS